MIAGEFRVWERVAESGRSALYRWCGDCGGTIAYTNEGMDGLIAIPIGAFADEATGAGLPALSASVFEQYKQPWLRIEGAGISHED